ncbi:MAG: pentapeptide repeat-containing protein [Actinophytocola sp.]|uniref:pentapeptide repeat-containing protein n=1 Tax=Actinophytocola sp. TaxID=1872138 RepID=UPI003D6AAA79
MFTGARFGDDVTFESTRFDSLADINGTEFHAHASFVRAQLALFQLNTEMWARADVSLPLRRWWPLTDLGPEPMEWQEDPEPVTRPDRDGTWLRISYDPVALLDRHDAPDDDPDDE